MQQRLERQAYPVVSSKDPPQFCPTHMKIGIDRFFVKAILYASRAEPAAKRLKWKDWESGSDWNLIPGAGLWQ